MTTRPSFTAAEARARLQPVSGRQPKPREGAAGAPRSALCPVARGCIDVAIAAGWEALSCASCPVAELRDDFAAAVLAEAAVANAQREDNVFTAEGTWAPPRKDDHAMSGKYKCERCKESISRKSTWCRSCAQVVRQEALR